jgi:hypothetical protein
LHVIVREFGGPGAIGDDDAEVVDVSDVVDLALVVVAELDAVELAAGLGDFEEQPAITAIRISAARTMRTCRFISATIDPSF